MGHEMGARDGLEGGLGLDDAPMRVMKDVPWVRVCDGYVV